MNGCSNLKQMVRLHCVENDCDTKKKSKVEAGYISWIIVNYYF